MLKFKRTLLMRIRTQACRGGIGAGSQGGWFFAVLRLARCCAHAACCCC